MPTTPQPDKAPPHDRPAPPTRSDAGHPHPTAAPQPSDGGPVLAAGQRPLPDYELVSVLGRGGFGEVWKAKGPGGFHIALKFVRLEQPAGDTEVRALELMKDVRHAHLLAIFGAWQRDGLLIIAMELADGTLLDRLRQAQAEGHPGIPREELLEYVREAAKGLDFLNDRRLPAAGGERPVGIQHKDVKPHNLLLAGGTIKVADFGLAKLLQHTVTAASGIMTVAYAPPEFFNDQATRWSDQYSLAVTYCELRGGRLPFEGNKFQMMAGHVLRLPDLSMLPEAERPAVARALAKRPEERWPTCRAFAQALAEAGRSAPLPPALEEVGLDAVTRPVLGEALLARQCREALDRTRGRPTAEDRAALAKLCQQYGVAVERANVILREVRSRWRKDYPSRRHGGEQAPGPAGAPCRLCGAPLLAAGPAPSLCPGCEAEVGAQPQPIPGYRIARQLNKDSRGVVWLALCSSDGRRVALKTITPAVSGSDEVVQRFLGEADILGQLRHPHIVAFHEAGEAGELLYLAMEYVPGTDAGRILARSGPLAVGRAVNWVCQALEALAYAHGKGFVHRDLKPASLLVAEEGGREVVKLARFGLAGEYQPTLTYLTMPKQVGGTAAFVPPEQIVNFHEAKPPADQYGMAATLYNLLTGKHIYDLPRSAMEALVMMLQEDPVPINNRRGDLPAGLVAAVHRGLARNPGDRFPDAEAFRQALLRYCR